MLLPEETEKKKQEYNKNADKRLQNIPPHITFLKLDMKCNKNEVMKLRPDATIVESIINPCENFKIEQSTTHPVVLLCVNMVNSREVIILSVGNNTIDLNANNYPEASPEYDLKIFQILQSIKTTCRSNKQQLRQEATQGNCTITQNCHEQPKIFELPSTLESVSDRNTSVDSNATPLPKHDQNTHLEVSENLPRPISSEYQMTRCFQIYNELFTKILKTFAIIYCNLINMLLTKHKNVPCLCSHYWHFKDFTQGYVLKCLLEKGQINTLNVMRNLYFIIITKCLSGTNIDIFFKIKDGVLTVYSDNQRCRFTQQILLNKDRMEEIDNLSSLHSLAAEGRSFGGNYELVNVQPENVVNSELSNTVPSSIFLPEYPSQCTFFEEEICPWHQNVDPEKDSRNKNESLMYDPKYDLNEIYVNLRSGIQELTESLRNFSHSTQELVCNQFCYTADLFNTFEMFNENLFQITSLDNVFKHSSKHFSWEKIGKPLLQTLAYTLFSSVL